MKYNLNLTYSQKFEIFSKNKILDKNLNSSLKKTKKIVLDHSQLAIKI